MMTASWTSTAFVVLREAAGLLGRYSLSGKKRPSQPSMQTTGSRRVGEKLHDRLPHP